MPAAGPGAGAAQQRPGRRPKRPERTQQRLGGAATGCRRGRRAGRRARPGPGPAAAAAARSLAVGRKDIERGARESEGGGAARSPTPSGEGAGPCGAVRQGYAQVTLPAGSAVQESVKVPLFGSLATGLADTRVMVSG